MANSLAITILVSEVAIKLIIIILDPGLRRIYISFRIAIKDTLSLVLLWEIMF